MLGDCFEENRRERGEASLDFTLSKIWAYIQGPLQLFCITRMAQKCPIQSGPDTQSVSLAFLFLEWSILKRIGYYPILGDFKFHDIHHKIEQCLGHSAE